MTLDQRGTLILQELPWTPELEEYLLHERPTQMDNRAGERERFANLLGNNLKTIEAQFGPDFAQAVLVEILGEHPEYKDKRCCATKDFHYYLDEVSGEVFRSVPVNSEARSVLEPALAKQREKFIANWAANPAPMIRFSSTSRRTRFAKAPARRCEQQGSGPR